MIQFAFENYLILPIAGGEDRMPPVLCTWKDATWDVLEAKF